MELRVRRFDTDWGNGSGNNGGAGNDGDDSFLACAKGLETHGSHRSEHSCLPRVLNRFHCLGKSDQPLPECSFAMASQSIFGGIDASLLRDSKRLILQVEGRCPLHVLSDGSVGGVDEHSMGRFEGRFEL